MKVIAMKGGDEYDALTRGGRRVRIWKSGMRAWVKRKFRRRERHVTKRVEKEGS